MILVSPEGILVAHVLLRLGLRLGLGLNVSTNYELLVLKIEILENS